MKLITFQRRRGSNRGGLLVNNTRILDLGLAYSKKFSASINPDDTAGMIDALRGMSSSILEILNMGDDSIKSCFQLEKMAREGSLEECLYSMGDCTLVAPIPVPPLALEFNAFERHATAEYRCLSGNTAGDLPDQWHMEPVFHLVNPNTIIGAGEKVIFPEEENRLDFEFQLAAVLGESISSVGIEEAEDAILGYTVATAWIGRDIQQRHWPLGAGPGSARAFATSLGPQIVTKDELPRLQEIDLTAHVNGEAVCSGSFADSAFTFPQMISFASQGAILPAGTVILSGGLSDSSGLERGVYLKTGDRVELQADQIGTLFNEVHSRRHARVFRGR